MTSHGDDEQTDSAWRDIVAHYGERPTLGPEPAPAPPPAADDEVPSTYDASPDPSPSWLDRLDEAEQAGRFRPPPAPPVPLPRTKERALAWAGLLLVPLLGLVATVLQIHVHPLVGWLMVLWCVGGFAYLTVLAPRTPRDPWDDGSRV